MKKLKLFNLITVSLFVLLIVCLTAAFLIIPDRDFSEEENRKLSQVPKFTLEKLADGTFSDQITKYIEDQFPMRDLFVELKGYSELALGKGENNGVLLGRDGQLAVRLFDAYKSRLERIEDTDLYSEENIIAGIEALNRFSESCELPVVTLIPPRSVDVACSAVDYPSEISDSIRDTIASNISEKAGYIDLFGEMRGRFDAGEYVYMRTDHHWTSYGAYLAYCEVMRSFGMEDEIIPAENFTVEGVKDFYGTTWSKAGFRFVGPDTLELWSLGNEDEFETSCYSVIQSYSEDGSAVKEKKAYKSFSSWLNRDYLDQKDKYAAFLDGTHNEQTVFMKGGSGREKLLVVKDSFANSLVQFLAQHFDLVIINLANKVSDVTSYADEYGCSRILFVYNVANLIETSNLSAIK
ncbi:MAG: hypothetical protein J6128_01765 [Clostridia bacterium]|nr:hypothetical protein [Clostridia bacterium]